MHEHAYLHGSQSQVWFLKEEGVCKLMSSGPTNPLPLCPTRVLKYPFLDTSRLRNLRGIYGSLVVLGFHSYDILLLFKAFEARRTRHKGCYRPELLDLHASLQFMR